ncbi:unnamed protein product, partial [Vitis vinifera]
MASRLLQTLKTTSPTCRLLSHLSTATAAVAAKESYEDADGISMKGVKISGRPLYLDVQATSPVDPRVLDAMLPYYLSSFGNPHSRTHLYGWESELAVEKARAQVAALINASPKEIVFTSGATESNNISVKGVMHFYKDKKRHVITTQTEHKPDTGLVSVMAVNNEIGVIQPIEEIGKMFGALYMRRRPRIRVEPQMNGGGQERGIRSGTVPTPLVVGMGAACELAMKEMDLLMGLKEVAVSSGSACTSASLEPSYVLRALGVDEDMAHTSIRFGIGRFTTDAEIDRAVELTVQQVEKLREMSPLYEMVKEGIDIKSIQWAQH